MGPKSTDVLKSNVVGANCYAPTINTAIDSAVFKNNVVGSFCGGIRIIDYRKSIILRLNDPSAAYAAIPRSSGVVNTVGKSIASDDVVEVNLR